MIPITLPSLLSLDGMTAFVYLVMAAVNHADLIPGRLVPIAAMLLGAVAGAAAAYTGGGDIGNAVLLGLVAGGLSSGVEEVRKGAAHFTGKVANAKSDTGSSDPVA